MAETPTDALTTALAHHKAGKLAEARALYDAILRAMPNDVNALHLRGVLARREGDLPTALRYLSAALAIDTRFAVGYSNFGNALQDNCQLVEAMSAHRTALALEPANSGAHRRMLTCLLYIPGLDPAQRFAAHADFARHQPAPDRVLPPPDNDRDPARPLRIGVLSSDLRVHPVSRTVLPWFEQRDRAAYQLYCYAEVAAPDQQSAFLQARCDGWRSTVDLDDRRVAELIRNDRIDILIVLAARFDGNRPLVACYRPAPVQVAMFDGATTGLRAFDYWVTDPVLTPPDSTERFTERLVGLPLLIHHPPIESAPPVAALPAATAGAITFGSFNNPTKISPRTVELWSRVLHAVPTAQLLLKYHLRFSDPALCARLRVMFGAQGLDPTRLRFQAADDRQGAHLAAYAGVDVALDTVPFSGSTTTFEALWMGVPVLTLAGDTMIARMTASMLTAVGLTDLIAASPDALADHARALAADLGALATLRAGLRARVAGSLLCDGVAYARANETLWRSMWRAWCAGDTG